MKYAHFADLHLGSWREPQLRDLSTKAFLTAIDQCIQQNVDFILFAGDLFNTSLPALDTLKIVTKKLKQLSNYNIPIYIIAGSHDFSPSGKTMIDVLEHAGLLINICRGTIDNNILRLHWTIDPKTGAKLTGILGRKGQLDQAFYHTLDIQSLEQETGYKIFLFHTTVSELLPNHLSLIESQPLSVFPKGFNYYAGGHIHHPTKIEQPPDYPYVTYPGALFPNNIQELERYSHGGYYLINTENNSQTTSQQVQWVPLPVIKHSSLNFDCSHKSPEVITFEILNHFHQQDLSGTIITIRLEGTIENGRTTDINFKEINDKLTEQGALCILRNTAKLTSAEFDEIKTTIHDPETLEEDIIKEHLQQLTTFDPQTEAQLIRNLLTTLNTTKKEGENNMDFQQRIETEIKKLLFLES